MSATASSACLNTDAQNILACYYDGLDERLRESADHAAEAAGAHALPNTPTRKDAFLSAQALMRALRAAEQPDLEVPQRFDSGTLTLYAALLAFLSDWANPEDLNFEGLVSLLSMTADLHPDGPYASPLSQIFLEIERGWSPVPAATPAEGEEIRRYFISGLITKEQLVSFMRFPSLEQYEQTRDLALKNREQAGITEEPAANEERPQDGERRKYLKKKSGYLRNSDSLAPGYRQRADGTGGVSPQEDVALGLYREFMSMDADVANTAAAKALAEPLVALWHDDVNAYYNDDQLATIALWKRPSTAAPHSCDLFDVLVHSALRASIENRDTPSGPRREYDATRRALALRRAQS